MHDDEISNGLRCGTDYKTEPVAGFTAKCAECESENISICYLNIDGTGERFETGYHNKILITCRDCGQEYKMYF